LRSLERSRKVAYRVMLQELGQVAGPPQCGVRQVLDRHAKVAGRGVDTAEQHLVGKDQAAGHFGAGDL
jgi:hypothetical protein